MRSKHRKWFVLAPLLFVAIAALLGWVVMLLWNAILVPVLSVSVITFWQAIGIFVLSKILFGGFKGGRNHKCCGGHSRWNEKWNNMSEEDRQRLKQEWGNRCNWGRKMNKEAGENI